MGFIAALAPVASTLGTIAGVAGTALSAISQYQQAKYQQKLAERNAKIAEQNANRTLQDSQVAEQRQDAKNAALLGSQIASQGASGINLESGSALDIRDSSARLGRLDTLTTRNNAERQAYNYRVQASDFQAQGELAGMSASNALLSGFINTAGNLASAGQRSLMSDSGSTAPKWDPFKMQKIGTF